MEQEQVKANLLRTLHRFGLIDYKQLDKIIDKLTVLMFVRLYSHKT